MPQKVRIALDAMGGDVGASVVIPGAAISLSRHTDTEFLLFGDRARIDEQLARHPALKTASRVIHADVAVSAGNTGALMAMARFHLRTLPGIDRPAIAAVWPTIRGDSVVLDLGATIGGGARPLAGLARVGGARGG